MSVMLVSLYTNNKKSEHTYIGNGDQMVTALEFSAQHFGSRPIGRRGLTYRNVRVTPVDQAYVS
jgi:hypothetical protein